MRINDMVRINLQSQQLAKKSSSNHLEQSKDGKVHLEGVDPDRDITGSTAHRRIVPVSDEVKKEITGLVRKETFDGLGMSNGEEKSKIINDYLKTVPSKERSAVAWTLGQLYSDTAQSYVDKIKENDPNWTNGQFFDKSILDNFPPKHIDIKV